MFTFRKGNQMGGVRIFIQMADAIRAPLLMEFPMDLEGWLCLMAIFTKDKLSLAGPMAKVFSKLKTVSSKASLKIILGTDMDRRKLQVQYFRASISLDKKDRV